MRGPAATGTISAAALVWALVGVLVAAPVRAEDAPAPEAAAAPDARPPMPDEAYSQACPAYGGTPSERRTRATGNLQYDGPADVREDRGQISRWRGIVELEGTVPVRPRLDFRWGAQVETDRYDLTDPDRIAPGDGRLLETTWLARLGAGADARLGDDWGIALGGAVTTSGAPNADFVDTLTYGGTLVLRHQFSPKFGLRLGVTVSTQLDGELLVLPVGGLDTGGGTGSLRFGVRGNGVRVGYALAPHLIAGVSARYDSRDWRLAPSDRVPEGLFRDVRIPVGLDVEYEVRDRLSVGLETGVNAYEEIHVEDRHGHTVQHVDADPSFWVGLTLTWVF